MKRVMLAFGQRSGIVLPLALTLLLPITLAVASDHIDGPVTSDHAVADITDLFAFPTPGRPGHLTAILDVYTGVAFDGHFSDQVTYAILVRPVRIVGQGVEASFQAEGNYRVSCTFQTPHEFGALHGMTVRSTRGTVVQTYVNESGASDDDHKLRVYAGRRSDPFFFNAEWAVTASTKGKLLPPKNSNVMQNINVLSIVVEIDVERELGVSDGQLFAVAGETTTRDGTGFRQLDRIGRPEITNFSLVPHDNEDLRDLYNAHRAFTQRPSRDVELFRQRLRDNVDWYDKLNETLEWTPERRDHLVEILLQDFLVVDIGQPCNSNTYFDIETSLLDGTSHSTCGGRVPNDDVMDVVYTLLINGGKQPPIRDGVDRATRLSSNEFPYLAPPNDGVAPAIKNFVGRAAGRLSVSGRLRWLGIADLASGVLALVGLVLLVILVVRVTLSRLLRGSWAMANHRRALFVVAGCFAMASLCAAITSAFSPTVIGALVTLTLVTAVAGFKSKPHATASSNDNDSNNDNEST